MALAVYAATSYYQNSYKGPVADGLDKLLYKVSRQIDSLTFNRIVAKGFENLTDFQKEILQQVTCAQADFIHENAEMLDSVINSYSINGVAVNLETNSKRLVIDNGVVMQADVYALLKQTGLCCRRLGA